MKTLIAHFDIVDQNGRVKSSFFWYKDSNNHHSIFNGTGCLYDGYCGETEWQRIKNDMSIWETFGMSIEERK